MEQGERLGLTAERKVLMTDPTINTPGGIEDDFPITEEPTRDGDIATGVKGVPDQDRLVEADEDLQPDEDATIVNDG